MPPETIELARIQKSSLLQGEPCFSISMSNVANADETQDMAVVDIYLDPAIHDKAWFAEYRPPDARKTMADIRAEREPHLISLKFDRAAELFAWRPSQNGEWVGS